MASVQLSDHHHPAAASSERRQQRWVSSPHQKGNCSRTKNIRGGDSEQLMPLLCAGYRQRGTKMAAGVRAFSRYSNLNVLNCSSSNERQQQCCLGAGTAQDPGGTSLCPWTHRPAGHSCPQLSPSQSTGGGTTACNYGKKLLKQQIEWARHLLPCTLGGRKKEILFSRASSCSPELKR